MTELLVHSLRTCERYFQSRPAMEPRQMRLLVRRTHSFLGCRPSVGAANSGLPGFCSAAALVAIRVQFCACSRCTLYRKTCAGHDAGWLQVTWEQYPQLAGRRTQYMGLVPHVGAGYHLHHGLHGTWWRL